MRIKTILLNEINLLVEKRIAQISSKISINFSFDVIKHTDKHADKRMLGRDNINGYDNTPITNTEIKELVYEFRDEIAEKIVYGNIVNGEPFVLKHLGLKLAIPVKPFHEGGTYWRLVIITVWREDEHNVFKVGKNQIVLKK